jgi:methyltransferase (TIGR00027 family)
MRTDNDTWDITSSVGSTALLVAAARALEAQHREPLAADPYAELFCREVGGHWADLLDGTAPDHKLKSDFGVTFQALQGARTRFFDNYFRVAADDGVRQIVILAAGLDSRAYRLPWPDGTVVYELDQPRVLEFKHTVLADHGDAPTADRREVVVDLRDDWPKELRDAGFDPSKPSAWIAEGLLMYLPATAQEQLYTGIDTLAASGSYVALEEMNPIPPEVLEAKRAEERADDDKTGQFFALIYNEKHRAATEWFGERGWDIGAIVSADYFRQVGRPVPAPDTDGGEMLNSGTLVEGKKR